MAYNTDAYYKYAHNYGTIRDALDYLWVSHYINGGDREKMLDWFKRNLDRLSRRKTNSRND